MPCGTLDNRKNVASGYRGFLDPHVSVSLVGVHPQEDTGKMWGEGCLWQKGEAASGLWLPLAVLSRLVWSTYKCWVSGNGFHICQEGSFIPAWRGSKPPNLEGPCGRLVTPLNPSTWERFAQTASQEQRPKGACVSADLKSKNIKKICRISCNRYHH